MCDSRAPVLQTFWTHAFQPEFFLPSHSFLGLGVCALMGKVMLR